MKQKRKYYLKPEKARQELEKSGLPGNVVFKKIGKQRLFFVSYKNPNLNSKHCNGVIAIGNFDGLHLGHQKVISEAKRKAQKNRLPFGIMTFEPVPVMFFSKKRNNHRINSLRQKKLQFKKLKLDFLIIIKFEKKFSDTLRSTLLTIV